MIINLDNPINFIIRPILEESVSSVDIIELRDSPNVKKVIAVIKFGQNNYTKNLTLWEGVDYDNIGQWTDTDAQARVKEICEGL